MRWRTRAGDEVSAALGEPLTKDLTAAAWRTALDPQGNWIPQVLAAADQRLTEVRRGVPDAAGLVIATDQVSARAYAAQLRRITGEAPDGRALRRARVQRPDRRSSRPARTAGWSPCGWSPRVSTCPASSVGVYATSAATPLFFAQAVGRFVRARRRGETASVFLPSVPLLLQHAAEMEVERDHALDRRARRGRATSSPPRTRCWRGQPGCRTARPATSWSSRRSRPRRRSTGCCSTGASSAPRRAVGSDEEADYLGLPGLLEPDQVATLLRARQSAHRATRSRRRRPPRPPPARRRCTGRSRRCARSSTGWWRPGTTAPVSRTAPCTPSCVRPVADRWPRRRPPSSCRRGST